MEMQSARIAALMAGLEAKALAAAAAGDSEETAASTDTCEAPSALSNASIFLTSKQENFSNTLHLHGNQATMNINPLILTNIQGSPYFKKDLYALKTFHEVIDELYYKVCIESKWSSVE